MDEKNETQNAEEDTAEGENHPAVSTPKIEPPPPSAELPAVLARLAACLSALQTTSDRVTHRTEIEVQSFDGTYPAAQFFRTYDQKTDWDGLTNTEKVLRLPRYLNNKPLEHFRRLRMETQHYIQVRQTFLDLYPETNEATYAQYFSMKLAGQPNLEEYYRNKTALGLQLGLPQEVILETLTEGLPPSDQRLVRIVPPENLGAWFRLVQRIRGSGAPSPRHPDEHAPPLLGPYAPTSPAVAPCLRRRTSSALRATSGTTAASPAPSPSVTRTSHWDDKCQKAFTSLKESLTQHPVLHLYKDELPCQVYCDASTLGIAGVLKQVHSAGKAYPVQYFSRALRVHERNYTISELECLAIVESVEKFRVYLMGRKFTIFSDHHALQWLKTIKNPSGRLFRWSLRLSCYEYEVRYIKGALQHEADLLSRNPFCGFLDATLIKNHQLTPSGESKLTIDRNGLQTLKRRGVTKIVVPDALVPDLLTKVHSRYNHPGISQMTRLISPQYYWKGMSEDISKTTKACAICQSTKPPRGPTFGELGQLPVATQPFDLVALNTIAGLAKYGNAKAYLHVVVDHFSRYTWTFPSKSTSITTYQQVIKRVLQDGSPKRLLTDRAPAFTSPKFRKFLINRNIHPLLTTSNNPQANGLCERLNATLTGKLRLLHLENPKAAWTKLAKRVTVVYNNTPHSVTGFPPGYLMFGVLPPELTEHVNPYPVLTTARRIAHERTQAKHLKDKHAYDQQHKTPHFEPGDLVLVKVYHHPNTGKLAPYFTGPYEILEIISPNVVRINRPNQPLNRNTDTVHVNKLQYYNENIRYIAPPTLIPHPAKPQSRTLPPLFEHLTPDLFTILITSIDSKHMSTITYAAAQLPATVPMVHIYATMAAASIFQLHPLLSFIMDKELTEIWGFMSHTNPELNFYLRQLKKKSLQLSKWRGHLEFNTICKRHQFIPPSLRTKDPVGNPFSEKITKKYHLELLEARIQGSYSNIRILSKTVKGLIYHIGRIISQARFTELIISLTQDIRQQENIIKNRHNSKLAYWKSKYGFPSTSETLDDESSLGVINMSSTKLSVEEERMLSLGLRFIPPKKSTPDIPMIIAGVEGAIRSLNHVETLKIRNAVTQVLHRSNQQTVPSNRYHSTINRLRKYGSIVITKSDKGNQTVILDSADYKKKMMDILTDEDTFKPISEKEKTLLIKSFKKSLINLKNSKTITADQFAQFTGSLDKNAYIYGSPKMHKPGVPLRPIIAYKIGSQFFKGSKNPCNIYWGKPYINQSFCKFSVRVPKNCDNDKPNLTSTESFSPKRALVLTKFSRYEFEKRKHSNLSETELIKNLKDRGSDYSMLLHHHALHTKNRDLLVDTLMKNNIETKVVNRLQYTDDLIDWADVIFTAGGDGTFLMAASKITSSDKPVIGVNSDPSRSVGYLCLPFKYTLHFPEVIARLRSGQFRWMWRQRIRVTLVGEHALDPPVELHNQQLQYPEYRFLDSWQDHFQSQSEDSRPPVRRFTLPIRALNEVFVGESLSSRVSYYELSVDSTARVKMKSSGLTVCTGTGSTSWYFNINKVTPQCVRHIFRLVNEETGGKLPIKEVSLAGKIASRFNSSLRFDASQLTLAYTIRDPVIFGTDFKSNTQGFANRIEVKSRMFDACLVIDGGLSFVFNDGALAELEMFPEDALRTVQLDC
ncbi:NADK2 [Cordylochernes scorpioides]|uniref:NAD(+) kinase n=1 Tax=Cordylochernes scorpioides TaxID=51811 RepID=A0ABY6LTV1_9ARAC|nr:NADK2 [Cordylochernes scorpioides]